MALKKVPSPKVIEEINTYMTGFMTNWLEDRKLIIAVSEEEFKIVRVRRTKVELKTIGPAFPLVFDFIIQFKLEQDKTRTQMKWCNFYHDETYTSLLSIAATFVADCLLYPPVCKILPSRHLLYDFASQISSIDINVIAPQIENPKLFVAYLQEISPKDLDVELKLHYYDCNQKILVVKLYDEFLEFFQSMNALQLMFVNQPKRR